MITHAKKSLLMLLVTGKSLPQYDNWLFMELPWKLQAQNMDRTCYAHVMPMFCVCSFHDNSMNNLLSYCGLVDARICASEKDLPVEIEIFQGQNTKLFIK